jgi:hypothetical protein
MKVCVNFSPPARFPQIIIFEKNNGFMFFPGINNDNDHFSNFPILILLAKITSGLINFLV